MAEWEQITTALTKGIIRRRQRPQRRRREGEGEGGLEGLALPTGLAGGQAVGEAAEGERERGNAESASKRLFVFN